MARLPSTLDSRTTVRLLDVLAALWLALWIGIGFLVHQYVGELTSLSRTVVLAGEALDDTATALDRVSGLPVVGADISDVVESARAAADSALSSGRSSRDDVRNLAVVLGVAVAAAPTAPLLVVYALLRRSWRRDPRAPTRP